MAKRIPDDIEVTVRVARKQADLPRFVVVPSDALAAWALEGTTTLEVAIDGVDVARRTIKPWGDDARWFVSITEKDCRKLGIDTGSTVTMRMRRSSDALPEELAALIASSPAAADAWKRHTSAQQRMLRNEIAALKQSATRARRARRWLLGE